MAQIKKSVLVAQSAEKMFHLVDSCENYPLFLPWCAKADLIQRTKEITAARLYIDFRAVKTHFATQNYKIFPQKMHIHFLEGPFKKLEGAWQFKALAENACKIEFDLHYEFSNLLLEKALGPVFSYVCNSFVDAFIQRAKHG